MTDGRFITDSELLDFAAGRAESIVPNGNVNARRSASAMASARRRIGLTYRRAHGAQDVRGELEWLLDNLYIIEREGRQAQAALYGAGKLRQDAGSGLPVVYAAAKELVISGNCTLSDERMALFLKGLQRRLVLSERELSVFIPMLQLALVEAVAERCRSLDRKADTGSDIIANTIASLRMLSSVDLSDTLEAESHVEQVLMRDPAGIYPRLAETTRQHYRYTVAELARKAGLSDVEAAEKALELAYDGEGAERHVGYFLYNRPLGGEAPRGVSASAYAGLIVLPSTAIAVLLSFLLGSWWLCLLIVAPMSAIFKSIVDYIVMRVKKPRFLPRLEIENEVPAEGRTLCVISSLLCSDSTGPELASKLERYRLTNRDCGENLAFAILADLPDSGDPVVEGAESWHERAVFAVEELNKKYGGGFLLLSRERRYNEDEGRYMGWERKRGALMELTRLIKGASSGIKVAAGDRKQLSGVRYIIALDSDTKLTIGSAKKLISAMLHPLNRPVIDRETRTVVAGHAILQPKISTCLEAANRSDFAKISSGQGGLEPYACVTSDLYFDLFERASYTGKGIIDVDALYECIDGRFQENRILSHDLIEGEYLRCGFIGEVELEDSCPYKAASYFDRAHRWTRGDWQLIPWLAGRVRGGGGQKTKNPLHGISKWKIFDNLRRSAEAAASFLCIFLAALFGGRALTAALIVALTAQSAPLLVSFTRQMVCHRLGFGQRYHSSIVAGFGGGLMCVFLKILLLPHQAWVSLSAAVTALYRLLVTKRGLLEWVTAAEAEKRARRGVFAYCVKMYAQMVLGTALLLSPIPAGKALGIVWLLAPAYAAVVSRENTRSIEIKSSDRQFLLDYASDIWRYFREQVNEGENWLPPDNYQEQPPLATAHRSSPTNIGLALLAAVAAADLGACKAEEAFEMITKTLGSIERLEKWSGHLYNWYDTQTMRPLEPRYVSTVDSGNLYGCLICLREAAEEYRPQGVKELCARIDALLDNMSFKPLYDGQRELFRIGYDATKGMPSESLYDLMASEARQTSYIAVAVGDVPKRHWESLGRTLTSADGYCGMASWSGTMFEYLMPNLLMPCYRNSMLFESSKFCVYMQKKEAGGDRPWGMSESAYYAFDATLSYRYKAHGVQKLAFKRGMSGESVISPYSTFLALDTDYEDAMTNLRRLKALGADGRYGMCEALDFTRSRRKGGVCQPVRTYMAHHLGMSMLAIANRLNDRVFQHRFMRNVTMSAYSELLQERVPVGKKPLRRIHKDVPEKPPRQSSTLFEYSGKGYDFWRPAAALLSNGAYNLAITDTGMSRAESLGFRVARFDGRQAGGSGGMLMFLRVDGELYPLQPAPSFRRDIEYSCYFTSSRAVINSIFSELECSVEVSVPDNENGERRIVTVKNTGKASRFVELVCYFEPVLAENPAYEAHRSFSKLSLESKIGRNSVIIRRKNSNPGRQLYLCFASDGDTKFDCSREKALGRGGLEALTSALEREPGSSEGYSLDPCVLARRQSVVPANTGVICRFSLAVAGAAQSASESATRILEKPEILYSSRIDGLSQLYGIGRDAVDTAMDLLPDLLFGTSQGGKAPASKSALWRFGISGDFPLVAAEISDSGDIPRAVELVKIHSLLINCGMLFDLALVTSDGGEYMRPQYTALVQELRSLGAEYLIGARGGLHIIDSGGGGLPELRSLSARHMDLSVDFKREEEIGRIPSCNAGRLDRRSAAAEDIPFRYLDNGAFCFETTKGLPDTAWTHILSNGKIGCTVGETGLKCMWYENAREMRVNAWNNDPLEIDGEERLCVFIDGRQYSPFSDTDGLKCTVEFGFGYARFRKEIGGAVLTTTVFVPWDIAARVVIIEVDGANALGLEYHTPLMLGPDAVSARTVVTEINEKTVIAHNPSAQGYERESFVFTTNAEKAELTCSELSYMTGSYDAASGAGHAPCIAARLEGTGLITIVSGFETAERMRALASPDRAAQELERCIEHWRDICGSLSIETGDDCLDCYMNGWAVYQIYCCRVLARSSIYQSGGAYGFRDQLQDCSALIPVMPEQAREQILRACLHQYGEGDVMHWWHPGREGVPDKGVRTRCSDDLLWLPYVLSEYVSQTGDTELCSERTSYLHSHTLGQGEHQRYEPAVYGADSGSVLDHALRAIELVLERGRGGYGLLLIGDGDWNDGFDKVGNGGRGESVWLSWFASYVLDGFTGLCEVLGEQDIAGRLKSKAFELSQAANHAWDGGWFLRGFYDDGSTLGSSHDEECRIDSIAQSFSALAPGADRERSLAGLKSAYETLYDRENKVVKLFTPAFDAGSKNPGYIKSYAPGVRENGGQYTHASVWLAIGLLERGMADEAYELINALLPNNRVQSKYKVEPYVLAADVYSLKGHEGRGGWTWYTGAAGWYYRAVREWMLGLRLRSGRLFIEPILPSGMNGYKAVIHTGRATVRIDVSRGGEDAVLLDESPTGREGIPLSKLSGEHTVRCVVCQRDGKNSDVVFGSRLTGGRRS